MPAGRHDIAIVGAGPVGSCLALALADADLDVIMLDARPERGAARDRSLALSHGTRLILERLGVWGDLAAGAGVVTPITDIDISQSGGFGVMRLHAADHGLPALGYVVGYAALQAALDARIRRTRTTLRYGVTVTAAGGTPAYAALDVAGAPDPVLAHLAVIADGSGAQVAGIRRRRHDYRQAALAARVWCREPHAGLAFERFSPSGPMALLPEGDHYGLVLTATPASVETLLAQDDTAFLQGLETHFGARRSGFLRVEGRRSFPLALEVAPSPIATRCVVIGNAAQALHPVAGQGFNLGVRDAFELGRTLVVAPRASIGDRGMLEHYARRRRPDRIAGVAFTHGLLRMFGSASPWLQWPRGIGLALLDAIPPAKQRFARAMLFGLR